MRLLRSILVGFLMSIATVPDAPAQDLADDPNRATLHTEDIERFWSVFDKASPRLDAKTFQKEYLGAGSEGLKGFIPMRIESGKNLSKVVRKNLAYYTTVRPTTMSIDGKKQQIITYFHQVKKLYPAAVFPDVYFVIGARNSGGTTFRNGLVVGAEMFGIPTDSFTPRIDFANLERIVIHELIHYQQKYAEDGSLLAQSIREGAADFICELATGSHPYVDIHTYGNAHEKELWAQFDIQKDSKNWSPWLYHTTDTSRPKDLGYWMGYQICKAYYQRSLDHSKAIHDILNIQDFPKFLRDSGYNGNGTNNSTQP